MVVPWVKRFVVQFLSDGWWPAGCALPAEKQVPRDEAARNDKIGFGYIVFGY